MNRPEHHDTHLTVSEAARIIGVDRDAILMHIHRGRLATIKDAGRTGRRWISTSDLRDAYPGLQRHAKGPRGPVTAMSIEETRAWLNDETGDDYLAIGHPDDRAEATRRLREQNQR